MEPGRAGRGGSANGAFVDGGRTRVFSNERKRHGSVQRKEVRLSSLGRDSALVSPSTCTVRRPAALMSQALDLDVSEGRGDKVRLRVTEAKVT